MSPAIRRPSVPVRIGHVTVGASHPIVVQSMTNTDTADVEGTALQVRALAIAGSELVRVTVNTEEAAKAVPQVVERLAQLGVSVPIVGDFHFNGHKLLREHPACAAALAKYRINPGNVGRGSKRDPQFAEMIEIACRHDKPVRIGVNWGSLDQDLLTRLMDENSRQADPLDATDVMREAIVVSALESARRAEELGLPHDRIVISCKVSGVQDLIAVYRSIAARCDHPLHLGLHLGQVDLPETLQAQFMPQPAEYFPAGARLSLRLSGAGKSLGCAVQVDQAALGFGMGRQRQDQVGDLAQAVGSERRHRDHFFGIRKDLHGAGGMVAVIVGFDAPEQVRSMRVVQHLRGIAAGCPDSLPARSPMRHRAGQPGTGCIAAMRQ